MSSRPVGVITQPGGRREFVYERRGPGPREQRRRKEERRRRRRALLGTVGAWVLAGALVFGYVTLWSGSDDRSTSEGGGTEAAAVQDAWLLIGTVESETSGEADWLAILAWDSDEEKGVYLYLPRTTYVEIPGFGLEVVGKARALNGDPLQVSAVANLMGVSFDHFLRISDQGVRALMEKAGGISVDVQTRLTREGSDGRIRTLFAEGDQPMSGERTAEYLTYTDPTDDELSRSIRHSLVWKALFQKFEGRPQELAELFRSSADLVVTNASPEELGGFFGAFSSVPASDILFETLPVESVGVDATSQFYRPEREQVESLVSRHLAGVRPRGAGEEGRRLQILNGNGRPGIGQAVADRLIPEGFRVVLNANARHFDYEVTEIVVYSSSDEALSVAREIREILGVGRVVISRQQQSLVDVTVVVGQDFLQTAD